jgi:soluble epoxide hydrolase/lipid-phosphate phosphatase
VHFHPSKRWKSNYLFIHGFPSSGYDWHHQVTCFSSFEYGVLAPDLLGCGDTGKPTSLSDCRGKKMAAEKYEYWKLFEKMQPKLC